MTEKKKKTTRLKDIFLRDGCTIAPFGVLPIHAQMAERAGFEMFEISGGMSAWWVGGVADVGWLTMSEVVAHAKTVADATSLPVFCDADTGYGTAVNVRRTVQEFVKAGIAGIHIEDQLEPKKAGGQAGIRIVSDEEAIGRLRAAVDAKDELDPDFVIVARTDAYASDNGSLDEAIRRANLYIKEGGADVAFFEGLRSWDEVARALAETDGPAYAIASRHAGPAPSLEELGALGQKIHIAPFAMVGTQAVWQMLLEIKRANSLEPYDRWVDEMYKIPKDSEEFVGYGDVFVKPSYDDVRRWEELYYPEYMKRDYENTISDDRP